MSVGFFRQEYWSGLPFFSPGDLLDPGIEPEFPALQADSLLFETPVKLQGNVDIEESPREDIVGRQLSRSQGEPTLPAP